jgi:uncharacterized membrane-anchored protein
MLCRHLMQGDIVELSYNSISYCFNYITTNGTRLKGLLQPSNALSTSRHPNAIMLGPQSIRSARKRSFSPTKHTKH